MTDVLIHSPFPKEKKQGNSVTADRLARALMDGGFCVAMETETYAGPEARCMVALNARRSAQPIADFKNKHPDSKLIIILTGTDINHPQAKQEDSPTWRSMEKADQLVLLHDASLLAVPAAFHSKCLVIYPSVILPEGLKHQPEGENFSIIMAGNMREEKNPDLAVSASKLLPEHLTIHIYGEYHEPSSGQMVRHGMVAHDEVLAAMSQAHVLLNTSIQEGGANAVCEAISLGLPVVASAIPGNIGMLGEDYEGLFRSNNLDELVSLLTRVASDQELYGRLKKQVAARAHLFAYSTEATAWARLVKSQLSS